MELLDIMNLKVFLIPISFKTLTSNFKGLEECNLIIRKEYQEIPPKVEYYLSDKGKSLMPILDQFVIGEKKTNKIKISCLFLQYFLFSIF